MDQSEAKFIIHLFARIEAIEALLVEKKIATKLEIQTAAGEAQKALAPFERGLYRLDEENFGPALKELLIRLEARHRDLIR